MGAKVDKYVVMNPTFDVREYAYMDQMYTDEIKVPFSSLFLSHMHTKTRARACAHKCRISVRVNLCVRVFVHVHVYARVVCMEGSVCA